MIIVSRSNGGPALTLVLMFFLLSFLSFSFSLRFSMFNGKCPGPIFFFLLLGFFCGNLDKMGLWGDDGVLWVYVRDRCRYPKAMELRQMCEWEK